MSKPENTVIGIDLGTTNSAIAIVGEDGVPRIIPVRDEPTLPSCVGIDPSGKLVVGRTALNQLIARPDDTVLSIKSRMGTDQKTPLGGSEYLPQEISSFILLELKRQAETALGTPVNSAVITVPAYFDEAQRKATKDAAALAGLEVLRILNEPTAAALAYDADIKGDQTLLVYDLGGGTFDVSVVGVERGIVEVKASHGDTHLGGDDFDQLLIDHVTAVFEGDTGINLALDVTARRRLKIALEAAKRTLSDQPFVHVREEFLSGEHHLDLEISRSDYEEMIAPLLERTVSSIGKALTDARITPADLDQVMLVGGSTRTPLVQSMIENSLGIEPSFLVDPDTVVALGAAVQAAAFTGGKRNAILVDVTAHTLGNVAIGTDYELVTAPVIRRNTPIPTRKSEVFFTMEEDQETVLIQIQQGESTDPRANTTIGKLEISGLGRSPSGTPVIVDFALDLDGMLHVSATHKSSGKIEKLSIDTHGPGESFEFEQASANIADLIGDFIDDDDDEGDEGNKIINIEAAAGNADDGHKVILTKAKDLRKRAEALLAGTSLGEDDRTEIQQHLDASYAAVKSGDHNALETHTAALEDIIFYLED